MDLQKINEAIGHLCNHLEDLTERVLLKCTSIESGCKTGAVAAELGRSLAALLTAREKVRSDEIEVYIGRHGIFFQGENYCNSQLLLYHGDHVKVRTVCKNERELVQVRDKNGKIVTEFPFLGVNH